MNHFSPQIYHQHHMQLPPGVNIGLMGTPTSTANGPSSTSANINTSVAQPTSLSLAAVSLGLGSNSVHIQKQLDQATISRESASPHHHARMAAAQARTTANLQNSSAAANGITTSTSSINGLAEDAPSKASQWTIIDLGGMAIKNLSREIFRYSFLTTLYLNHNQLGILSPEIKNLVHLTVLDLSGNRLVSLPSELGMLTRLKELLLFDNQLSILPMELGFLYQLDVLGLEGNPLAEPIASLMHKDGTTGVVSYLRDNCPMTAAPQEREWIAFEEEGFNASDVFTLFCYNILCERYASPQAYAYVPSWALNWEYRREMLMQQEIMNYNADIVCLQEIETGQYDEYFKEQMALAEYEGVFYPKSRARTMDDFGRKQVDGCATFFKTSRFNLLNKTVVEFQQIAMQRDEFRKTENVFNRVMTRDNIAVLTLLENKETRQKVMIANAHLHWDPSYRDVKLLQTKMLVEEIANFLPNRNIPVLICGDFNSMPTSGVYEFLTTGTVPQDHEDMTPPPETPTGSTPAVSLATVFPEGLSHNFSLKSAYSLIDELEFTNWTPNFRGIIDYIFHDPKTLQVAGLLGNVDKEYCSRHVGFPNWHHPSDHIPLLAQFKWVDDAQARRKNYFSTFGSDRDLNTGNTNASGSGFSGGRTIMGVMSGLGQPRR